MASKEQFEIDRIVIDCLRTHHKYMTEREREFADGIIAFHQNQKALTQKQSDAARKLAVRLICERTK